jgi:DNA-binding IclR family transcriptional regulator
MSKIVGRTLDFLELFAEQRRPLSLSEIARLLGIPPSSCHDVLHALEQRGYVYELGPRGGFYPTQRLFDMAKTISDYDPIVLRADLLMRELRDALGESVLLAKANGLQATYLLAFEPSNPLRFLVRVGDNVRSLHATSAGKALLASLPPAELDAFFKSTKLVAMTARTLTSEAALRQAIAEGNARGWFVNHEESQEGVTTVSARFHWSGSVYIVSIAGPTSRVAPKLDAATGLLTTLCRRLEAAPGTKLDQ